MKKYLLYGYGGAYNHGAEAILRTTIALLRQGGGEVVLSSHFPVQDKQYGIDLLTDKHIPADLSAIPKEKGALTFEEKERAASEIYRDALMEIDKDTICIGIGGDNYCYPNWHRQSLFHHTAKKRGAKSVLWCCSIQPEVIDERMTEVLNGHDVICARESITLKALRSAGISCKTMLLPDPAFSLAAELTPLPEGFQPKRTVGINLSPLALRSCPQLMTQFVKTSKLLLERAGSLLLLSHVEMPMDNDRDALEALSDQFTPEERHRIFFTPTGLNALQLKYLISQCSLLICCRTHASIAAYSTSTPTVVAGYSVKSEGIGRDIGMEQWVLPLEECERLPYTASEAWIQREALRSHLEDVMSDYITLNKADIPAIFFM